MIAKPPLQIGNVLDNKINIPGKNGIDANEEKSDAFTTPELRVSESDYDQKTNLEDKLDEMQGLSEGETKKGKN